MKIKKHRDIMVSEGDIYGRYRKVDYDQLCKRLIKMFFKEFLDFFFPEMTEKIDFNKDPVFIDKELFSDQVEGEKTFSDILARVALIDGTEEIALIHIEIQAKRETGFEERMYDYFSDIRREHKKNIFAFALFIDEHIWEKPVSNVFHLEYMGTELTYKYNLRKTKDYNYKDYINHPNPITSALMTRMNFGNDSRALVKANALRQMKKYKLTELQEQTLLHFIDRLLFLNKKEKKEFTEIISKDRNYEEVAHMLTTWQEDFLKEGMEKGMEKAKLDSAKKMLEDKIDINLIAKYTGLMIKEIQELMKSNGD